MQAELRTRFTDRFGLRIPLVCAPMAGVSGGALAAAVSGAGALGFVGGGYGDVEWTRRELERSDARAIGCGFVTWAIAADERAFDLALEFKPRALFLSFGDPRKFAQRARDRGIPVFCQIQTLAQLPEVLGLRSKPPRPHWAGAGPEALISRSGGRMTRLWPALRKPEPGRAGCQPPDAVAYAPAPIASMPARRAPGFCPDR